MDPGAQCDRYRRTAATAASLGWYAKGARTGSASTAHRNKVSCAEAVGAGSSRPQTQVTEAQLVIARGTDGSSWDINISGPQALLFTAADQGGQLRCLSIHENLKT